jgi:hypothetical protein
MNWLNLLTLSSVLQGPVVQAETTPTTAATTVVTATATLTTTADPTITPLVVTPPPVATPPVAGTLQGNPFSGDFLTRAADPPLGPFSIGFLLLSLILLGAGLYFYFVGKERWRRTQPLRFRVANTWSIFGMVLGALGLLFILFRVLNVTGLNIHLWLYLMGLVLIGFAAYAAYYFLVRYPRLVAAAGKRQGGARGAVRATARARGGAPAATGGADAGPAPAPKGSPGNPRGTSARGERRRAKM